MIKSGITLNNLISEEEVKTLSFEEYKDITICLVDAIKLKYKINKEGAEIILGMYFSLLNDMVMQNQNIDKDKK